MKKEVIELETIWYGGGFHFRLEDDKNGYVDDVNGWNFLGDSKNENLEYISLLKKTEPESKKYNE